MLNSKRDISIKRYLSKVGKKETQAYIYNSIYYRIEYNEKFNILIRFSDHFNNSDKNNIDIIHRESYYIVKSQVGISLVLTEDTILPYLKSLLLIYPEIHETLNNLKESNKRIDGKYKSILMRSNKLSDFEKLEKENKNLKNKINLLNHKINQKTNLIGNLKKDFNRIKQKFNETYKLFNQKVDAYENIQTETSNQT